MRASDWRLQLVRALDKAGESVVVREGGTRVKSADVGAELVAPGHLEGEPSGLERHERRPKGSLNVA